MGYDGESRAEQIGARIAAYVEERVDVGLLDRLARPTPSPANDAQRFERIAKRVFSQGLSSWIVQRRWPATLDALGGGDAQVVAGFGDREAAAFLANPAVIRNGRKLAATRHNAAVVVALVETYGDLAAYASALARDSVQSLLDDLTTRFRLVGPVSAARIAQDLGVDAIVPHRSVLRLCQRLGWLEETDGHEAFQRLASDLAPDRETPAPAGRFGAVLLAFATGRWSTAAVCGAEPACDVCPVKGLCPRRGLDVQAA